MATFTIEARGLDELFAKLDASRVDAAVAKAMGPVSRNMRTAFEETFRDQRDPWGNAWLPLAPTTKDARKRRGKGPTPVLFDSGAMYDSHDNSFTPTTASVSIDGPAEVHQFGSTTAGRGNKVSIPPRPMFPLGELEPPDDWWDAVTRPIVDAVERIFD